MTHVQAYNAKKDAKIKAIITDLGGVLINVDHGNMCAEFAKHSPLPAEEIGKQLSGYIVHSSGAERNLSKGLIMPKRFYTIMCKQLKLRGLSFMEFERIYSNRFTPKKQVLALMRQLSNKYVVAMLSNTNKMHYGYWARTLGNYMKMFKHLILSFQVHAAKPEPEIFLAVLRKLKLNPEHCVFIDDVEEYVKAARKLGMRGIRFTSAKQLQRDLMKCGVAP